VTRVSEAESPITNQFDRCNISTYQVFDAGTGINWYTGVLGLDSAVASRLPGVVRGTYRFTTVSKGAATITAVGTTYLIGAAGSVHALPCTVQ
jgi:hypothetical protein